MFDSELRIVVENLIRNNPGISARHLHEASEFPGEFWEFKTWLCREFRSENQLHVYARRSMPPCRNLAGSDRLYPNRHDGDQPVLGMLVDHPIDEIITRYLLQNPGLVEKRDIDIAVSQEVGLPVPPDSIGKRLRVMIADGDVRKASRSGSPVLAKHDTGYELHPDLRAVLETPEFRNYTMKRQGQRQQRVDHLGEKQLRRQP